MKKKDTILTMGDFSPLKKNLLLKKCNTKRAKNIILLFLLFMVIGIVGASYALFSVSVEKPKTFTLISGNLTYLMSSAQLSSNKATVSANNTITFDITIESQNAVESSYILYYLNALPSGVTVSYITSNDLPSGTIGVKGTKKIVRITISNTGSASTTIEFGIKGGLDGKILALDSNQNSISKKIYGDTSGASVPELDAGMIPVYYEGNILKKADTTAEWYNYNNKQWANAILVNSASRAAYQNAAGGTTINTADVLAYFVWIPRYRYQLFNVEGVVSTTPQSVSIVFEDKNTPKSNGTTNGSYLTAPGFTFGTLELNGFWVGKFEMTGDTTTPTVLPNVAALANQTVSTLFETNQKFKTSTYGLTLESKMMKESEWGAVAYLSHSKYGINTEVRINNYWDYATQKNRTGCGATTENGTYTNICEIVYGSASSYPQSTTGNITGIFDMSGGCFDIVMGALADASGKPRSGYSSIDNSGYTGMLTDGSTYSGKALPATKYYDVYTGTTYLNSCNGKACLGQGIVETQRWYNDNPFSLSVYSPWSVRGGSYAWTSSAGLFSSSSQMGASSSTTTSRTVIVP